MTIDLDRVETRGLELEASYSLDNGLYFDFAGNLVDGDEVEPGGVRSDWRNNGSDRVQLTVGKRWDSRFDLSWEVIHAVDRKDSFGADLSNVTLHNLRGTWRPDQGWLEGAELRAGIENLLDEDYIQHLSVAARNAPGRNFKLTLSKAF